MRLELDMNQYCKDQIYISISALTLVTYVVETMCFMNSLGFTEKYLGKAADAPFPILNLVRH